MRRVASLVSLLLLPVVALAQAPAPKAAPAAPKAAPLPPMPTDAQCKPLPPVATPHLPLGESLDYDIDVLAANTPYVPSEEVALMPVEARDHEPRGTLDGGPDGLALLRRISATATDWLAPGGFVLIEVSERQLPVASAVFEADGLTATAASDDDLAATVVIGRAPG